MTISSKSDLFGMQRIGSLVAQTLARMSDAARPGITTAALDDVGAAFLRSHGARSAPQFTYGFPGFNLISVNDEIVHGIPGPRILRPGDVVKLDVTAELGGYIADAACTVLLPPVSTRARKLRDCAITAFDRALDSASAGNSVAAIGRAVETEVRRCGFSIVRELTGHGVGRTIHEPPAVPNYYSPFTTGTLTDGLVITIEPLISAKPARALTASDGWTVRTSNGALAAHYEHTVLITSSRPLLLTSLS